MALRYATMYKCPVIQYTRKVKCVVSVLISFVFTYVQGKYNIQRKAKDVAKILSGYRKFAKHYGLSKKHIISMSILSNLQSLN